MIPLMTRRSSTLGLPRVSLGRCGLSRANCSSLSQKESRSIIGLPSETLNHDAPRFGNQFMGPEPKALVADPNFDPLNTVSEAPALQVSTWRIQRATAIANRPRTFRAVLSPDHRAVSL